MGGACLPAWGKEAYAVIAEDDKNATSPGDRLRELFVRYGPCLILIDEWVAYARQLHDTGDLPGGALKPSSPSPRPSRSRLSWPRTASWWSPCPLPMPGARTWRWGALGAGRPWSASGTWWGGWSLPGGRQAPRRALRSSAAASSSPLPTPRPTSTGTPLPGPLPTSTGPTRPSFRRSAPPATTRSASKGPFPSTPRSLTACTRTGPPW